MKAPFVWFGGKRRVAPNVWAALGDVDNYVEPFAGSLAVLLERPHNLADGTRRAETVNDADHYLANFWRALASDPETVAAFADWPVNEDDLFARHLWLVNEGRETLAAGLECDPMFYDAKIAGWWVWGVNAWIGGGWCSGTGPWDYEATRARASTASSLTSATDDESQLPHLGDAGQGVNRKRPHLGDAGQGVNRKLPHLGDAGQGVNRQLPHLGDAGQGVNRQLPHLGDAGRAGYNNLSYRTEGIAAYMRELAERLRDVRVCTGDWSRVVTKGALSFGASVGVFLDPPYAEDVRTAGLYASETVDVAIACRDWAVANGDNPRYRIVLAGYSTEHDDAIPKSWRRIRWSASAAYQTSTSTGGNKDNRHCEVLWCSPHCLVTQASLFDEAS
jgi:site-specific DNA-adenine methylase